MNKTRGSVSCLGVEALMQSSTRARIRAQPANCIRGRLLRNDAGRMAQPLLSFLQVLRLATGRGEKQSAVRIDHSRMGGGAARQQSCCATACDTSLLDGVGHWLACTFAASRFEEATIV